jgi:tripartite-type tricarboxylate transporter receptor subunit TctC
MLVAAAAGGYADAVARIIGERLSEALGQSFVVENRGGAGGNIAAKVVASSPADGYTILVSTTQFAINETLYKNAGVKAAEFRPVSIPVSAPARIFRRSISSGSSQKWRRCMCRFRAGLRRSARFWAITSRS